MFTSDTFPVKYPPRNSLPWKWNWSFLFCQCLWLSLVSDSCGLLFSIRTDPDWTWSAGPAQHTAPGVEARWTLPGPADRVMSRRAPQPSRNWSTCTPQQNRRAAPRRTHKSLLLRDNQTTTRVLREVMSYSARIHNILQYLDVALHNEIQVSTTWVMMLLINVFTFICSTNIAYTLWY